MLRSCPRCTQMLPADAAFCRRCGATVGVVERASPVVEKKRASLLTPILAALLVAGLVLAALVFVSVGQSTRSVQQVNPANSTYYSGPPLQATYPPPINSQVPVYPPPVVVTPIYPGRLVAPRKAPNHHDEWGR